eukprot:m.189194 g.189194  ORF g.189194 m.189194 type:complete len:152 (+) comp15623_c0_seq13:556-1011(+)
MSICEGIVSIKIKIDSFTSGTVEVTMIHTIISESIGSNISLSSQSLNHTTKAVIITATEPNMSPNMCKKTPCSNVLLPHVLHLLQLPLLTRETCSSELCSHEHYPKDIPHHNQNKQLTMACAVFYHAHAHAHAHENVHHENVRVQKTLPFQ